MYEIIAGNAAGVRLRSWVWTRFRPLFGSSTIHKASIALIENLQREGLTSIEEAVAYQKLIDLHQLTQESLAQRLGKSQSTIANKIRLLHWKQSRWH